MSQTMDTTQKLATCLDYIDERLEKSAEQTINIAELIIDDIKELAEDYHTANKQQTLEAYAQKVHHTQMKWVNQLQDIILEQANRDLNGQVIQSLQTFTQQLGELHTLVPEFNLPSAVARENTNEFEYLTQDQIEALFALEQSNSAAH